VLLDHSHVLRYSTHVHLTHVVKVNPSPFAGGQESLSHVLEPEHFPSRISDWEGFWYELDNRIYSILLVNGIRIRIRIRISFGMKSNQIYLFGLHSGVLTACTEWKRPRLA